MTVYRKGEYVWGYSPSQEEMKTKKTFYTMQSQITSPLNNPSADYVFYERPIRSVDVSGWATVEPSDGTLNEIWVNGVKLANPASLFAWSEPEKRYNFTIPVPVQNGRNIVDVTLFSGPPLTCEECYGCAVSNHHFYIEFQGAKQYPSILVLRDEAMQPAGDTMKLDTSKFHIQVTDRNGNQNGKSPDLVTVWIKNFDNSDSISVILNETGDSTGIFVTSSPISVVDRMPEESGAGQIAMNGGDRVRIWYIDPTDSTDSSEAYITSRATFPRAVRGWLKDVNGDGSVDHMVVEYTIAVKVNPDSISVNFPSSGTTIMTRNSVDMMNIEGSRVTVGFAQPLANGITGFTSALYGSGMSYLTSGGLVRRSVFEVYDSVGPVLNDQAVVSERGAPGDDTVEITLSEFVKNTGLAGEELFLRRGGIDHPVTVIRILSENPEQYSMTVLCNVGETSFTAGDSLRFNSAGQVSDFAGNGPHPENRAVPVRIKAALPRIIDASYLDTNADGIIDLVRMEFSKDIDLELVDIGIEWNRQKIVTVDSLCTFVPGSSVQMTIAIGESFTNNIVGTGAAVRCAMVASGNSADTIFTEVNDGAAPVIDSAWFNLYSGELTGAPVIDTLRIAFSETTDSESVKTITVFGLMNGRQIPYTFYVDSCRMLTLRDYLFYGRIEGVEFPRTGDLIWLHPTSSVSDAGGNIQQSIDNRRAPVIVSFEVVKPGSIKKFVYPNPFNPDKGPVMIRLAPPVGLRFPVEIDSSAWMVFYDKVGNKITDKIHSVLNGTDAVLYWNGINKKGRKVGEGTYLCYLYFLGEKEKVPIGVIRE